MTTSAQRGHMAFCAYETGVANGAITPLDDDKYPWQRHKAIEVSMAPQEFSDLLPASVGGELYPEGSYKLGAYVGGTFTVDARLKSSFGHLLYAVAGYHEAIAADEVATPKVAAGTKFGPDPDDQSTLPWLGVRRFVPAEAGGTPVGTTEYFMDCRMSAMTLTLPQMGFMQAQCAVVGRKPLWKDNENVINLTDADFEDTGTIGMSHSTTVELTDFATQLGDSGKGGKFTGGQIIFSNGTTTPQQEMILGSMYPDTFLPLSRSVAIRLVYKWKDQLLYKKLWQIAASGSPVGYDQVWNPSPVSSAVKITVAAVELTSADHNPYRFIFEAYKADWTMSAPTLVPGRMIQTELTGIVKTVTGHEDEIWSASLLNGAAYTFGT